LNIGRESSLGLIVGVRNVVTCGRFFACYHTKPGHLSAS
jgi:hypothetical protein